MRLLAEVEGRKGFDCLWLERQRIALQWLQAPAVIRQLGLGRNSVQLGELGAQLLCRCGLDPRRRLFGHRLNRLERRRRLIGQYFDVIQRIGQGGELCLPWLWRLDNRRFFFQWIAEAFQTFLGHIENQVALAAMIFGQTLEVVLDAGDGIGQGVQALPVRHGLARQQLFLDVAVAGIEQLRGPRQRNHRQAATHLGQQRRHTRQMFVIPL
ncbi:hypothetical protein D3C85_412240 [compost metagenome]